MPNIRSCALALSVLLFCLLTPTAFDLRATDSILWKNIGFGGGGNMVNAAVNPADPNIVLMGSDVGGIFWSGDGGSSWKLVNTVAVTPSRPAGYGMDYHVGFAIDPVNPNIVYSGPLKSTDYGQTWSLYVDDSSVYGGGLVVDSTNHNIVCATYKGTVYRSSDGWQSTSCQGATGGGTVCAPGGVSCAPSTKCYQQSCLPVAGWCCRRSWATPSSAGLTWAFRSPFPI